jgi:hypothetical protein
MVPNLNGMREKNTPTRMPTVRNTKRRMLGLICWCSSFPGMKMDLSRGIPMEQQLEHSHYITRTGWLLKTQRRLRAAAPMMAPSTMICRWEFLRLIHKDEIAPRTKAL